MERSEKGLKENYFVSIFTHFPFSARLSMFGIKCVSSFFMLSPFAWLLLDTVAAALIFLLRLKDFATLLNEKGGRKTARDMCVECEGHLKSSEDEAP